MGKILSVILSVFISMTFTACIDETEDEPLQESNSRIEVYYEDDISDVTVSVTNTETESEPAEKPDQTSELVAEPVTEPAAEVAAEPVTEPVTESTAALQLISVTSPCENGSVASLTIVGKPNTEYRISVYYSSGRSEAQGLENKISDSNGKVTWEWKVGPKTKEGKHNIEITGGGDTIKTEFETYMN